MKKILFPALIMIAIATSCSKTVEYNDDEVQQQAIADASHQELAQAIADRDSLLGLYNDINADVARIKELEGILSAPDMNSEIPERTNLRDDLLALRAALAERRERLKMFERSLAKSKLANKQMQATIDGLNAQIEQFEAEIDNLQAQLTSANERIGELNNEVDSLNTTVSQVSAERDEAQGQSQQLTNELNTVYYVYASKKELKDHNIVEGGGFLQKSKTMQGDFDTSFFVKADKRYLSSIDLHAKKAKVLTPQPENSYRIDTNADGGKVLIITNASRFWSTSPYLVIQID